MRSRLNETNVELANSLDAERKLKSLDFYYNPKKWKHRIKTEHVTSYQYNLKKGIYSMLESDTNQTLYVLRDKGEVVYIGQTRKNNPYERPMNQHEYCERSPKKYDEAIIFTIPLEMCLDMIESLYILHFKPKYNKWDKKGGIPIDINTINLYKKQYTKF